MKIELSECPEILRDKVEKYMSSYDNSKLICVSKSEYTSFTDKSDIETKYTVTIERYGLFTSMKYCTFNNGNHYDIGVLMDLMTVDQIRDIIENSDLFVKGDTYEQEKSESR